MLAAPLARPLARPLDAGATPLLFAGHLHQGWTTFTRASAATLWDGETLTAYDEDVPRFDRQRRLVIEEAATNLRSDSSIQTIAAGIGLEWYFGDSGTVTSNQGVSPDGTTTAALVNLPGESSRVLARILDGVVGTVYTGSFWIRSVSGTGDFPIDAYDGSAYIQGKIVSLTEDWQREYFTVTAAGAELGVAPGNRRDVSGETLTQALIWGLDLKAEETLTSYIPTSGSATTRAADVLTYTPGEAQDITLYGTAQDGTDYTSSPLVYSGQTTEWVCPAGVWSSIVARRAA